jgi:hypothetical protein
MYLRCPEIFQRKINGFVTQTAFNRIIHDEEEIFFKRTIQPSRCFLTA